MRIRDDDGYPNLIEPICLNRTGANDCEGKVEYHSTDPGRHAAFPRCEKHWRERLARREASLEKYADSDVPPPWFDPTLAGERWSEDD